MKRLLKTFCLILGLTILFVTLPVLSDEDHEAARYLKNAGKIFPLEKILETAIAMQPGRVIEVEFEKEGERYVYEVKFRGQDGGVWELYFDAVTGEFVKRGRED